MGMSDYLDINNEELLKDFFSEAEQQVENLESNILVIENDPSNREAIDEIFRAAHTLKGGSATVEMTELSGFTHVVEDLLDEIRSDRVDVTGPVVDVLLSSIDVIKAMLEARQDGGIYDADVEPIKNTLKSFIPAKEAKGTKKTASAPAPVAPVQPVAPAPVAASSGSIPSPAQGLSEYELLELRESCDGKQKLWGVTVMFDESNLMNSVGGIQVFAALKGRGLILKTIPDFDALYSDEFHPQVIYFVATEASADELEAVSYVYAADGDTIVVCDSSGEEFRVRLIGIDTEESVHEDELQNNEFGLQASEYTKALLEDVDTLYLEYDVEQHDQYDRVLAYVWLAPAPDEICDMLNATLVQDGYARAVVYEPNHQYSVELENLQNQAQEDRSGLWKYEAFWILTEE